MRKISFGNSICEWVDDSPGVVNLRQIQIGWVVLVLDTQLFEDRVFRRVGWSCERRSRDDRGWRSCSGASDRSTRVLTLRWCRRNLMGVLVIRFLKVIVVVVMVGRVGVRVLVRPRPGVLILAVRSRVSLIIVLAVAHVIPAAALVILVRRRRLVLMLLCLVGVGVPIRVTVVRRRRRLVLACYLRRLVLRLSRRRPGRLSFVVRVALLLNELRLRSLDDWRRGGHQRSVFRRVPSVGQFQRVLARDHRRRRSEALLFYCRARGADLRFGRLTRDVRPSHLLRSLLLMFSRWLVARSARRMSTVQSNVLHTLLNFISSIMLLIIATIVVVIIIIRLSHIVTSPRMIIVA